jgi:putative transposase
MLFYLTLPRPLCQASCHPIKLKTWGRKVSESCPAYSNERKAVILNKLLPPFNMAVAEVAREEGISAQTLYNWRSKAKESGLPVPGKTPTAEQWSADAKLAVVIKTTSMTESELSQYCQEKVLYAEQVKNWKKQCLGGF